MLDTLLSQKPGFSKKPGFFCVERYASGTLRERTTYLGCDRFNYTKRNATSYNPRNQIIAKTSVTTGRIPDETPTNLQEQILMQDALAAAVQSINCKEILGTSQEPLRDAPRLVANYGGNLEDWVKMASTQTTIINGASVQVHWFRNRQTLENVEFKFKRQYLKISSTNI